MVLLFPLMGLVAGILLMPPLHPRWSYEYPADKVLLCLGFVADGSTILLEESPRMKGDALLHRTPEAILGIDTVSGKQIFRQTKPEEFAVVKIDRLSLSPDKIHVAFNRDVLSDPKNPFCEVGFYDCVARRITRRVKSRPGHGHPRSQIIAGSSAIANGGGTKLLVWKDQSEWSTILDLGYIADPELSSDGKYIIVRKLGTDAKLELFDVASLNKVFSIPGYFEEVIWSADNRSFLAIENLKFVKIVAKRFEMQQDGAFALVPGSEVNLDSVMRLRNDNPYLTVKCHPGRDPMGNQLMNWAGDRLKFLVDRLWPVESFVQIRDGTSGHLVHRVKIPTVGADASPFTHPNGLSVALCDSKTLNLWEVYPTTRWYPRIGLTIGMLLSAFFTWRLIKTARLRRRFIRIEMPPG